MTLETLYQSAEAEAARLGAQHGKNAASWVEIDETNAARILAGMDDCDPEVMDSLPAADLSGQWAGDMTGPDLVRECIGHDEDRHPRLSERIMDEAFSDICDRYSDAFHDAVEAEVARRCRYYLGGQS